MNIEQIARKALTVLKLKWGMPETGFIAGGSLANTMWEIVSGNKAVVNDIDVFMHQPESKKDDKLFKYKKVETSYFESYQQMSAGASITETYTIKESTNNGIFNKVKYESKNNSPQLIIDSFDINCTQVGYSISEDKFYWTEQFVEFLKSGDLKVTNLNTPAHTAIRISKKKNELNAYLNNFEIDILQFVLMNKHDFYDIDRVRFMERYANMYRDNEAFLSQYFDLKRDEDLEGYLLNTKGIQEKIYFLDPVSINSISDLKHAPRVSSEFLFYIRNIYRNEELSDTWEKLFCVYTINNYISKENTNDEIKFVSDFVKSYPDTIKNLKGMSLSQQFYIIDTVLRDATAEYDYETAVAILENTKFDGDKKFDVDDILLLGLSVRKKIKSAAVQNYLF